MEDIDKLMWFLIILVFILGFIVGFLNSTIGLIAVFIMAVGIAGMAYKSDSVMKTFGDYKPAIIIPTTTAGFAFIGVVIGYIF